MTQTIQQPTLQQWFPEFLHYMDTHANTATLHHANGIITNDECVQSQIVHYWIRQLLHTDAINIHPDVRTINPDGPTITRKECMNVMEWIYTKPQHTPFRIVYIVGAHRLNASAANSMLKLIEEPPIYAVFFLTTHTPYGIPATVRSRVQWFWISTPPSDTNNDQRLFWLEWLQQPLPTRDTMIQEYFFHSQKTKESIHELPKHLTTLQGLFHDMICMKYSITPYAPTATTQLIQSTSKRYSVKQLALAAEKLLRLEQMCRAQVNKKNIIEYLTVAL